MTGNRLLNFVISDKTCRFAPNIVGKKWENIGGKL